MVWLTRLPLARPGCVSSPRSSLPQQLIAAAAVIALGLCAVAFVATQGDAPQEDSVANLYSQYVSRLSVPQHVREAACTRGLVGILAACLRSLPGAVETWRRHFAECAESPCRASSLLSSATPRS
jgi:hypothetical protein